jgi:hypothetical protein
MLLQLRQRGINTTGSRMRQAADDLDETWKNDSTTSSASSYGRSLSIHSFGTKTNENGHFKVVDILAILFSEAKKDN